MRIADELDSTITRARQHDRAALESLIDAYSVRLYAFLYRLTGRHEDTEDLVQEVFVRLVQHIGDYEHNGRFEPWLFRIAANLARDRVRRLSRRPHLLGWDSPEGNGSEGARASEQLRDHNSSAPDHLTRITEDIDRLQQALAQLPPSEREIVMLRHYSDMTFAEIAEAMSIPLGTALARSHRGLAKLRRIMEPTS